MNLEQRTLECVPVQLFSVCPDAAPAPAGSSSLPLGLLAHC